LARRSREEANKLVADGLLKKSTHPSDARRVQLTVTDRGSDMLTRLAAFQRPVNDALFGTLTRDEFRLLSQLLGRLAAESEHAVTLASYVEASLAQERLRAASGAKKTERRPKSGRRG
jgi:hypothetical protein